jgi:processive 1,2-diacylglycerol beta-glucosyltransferase
VGIASDPLNRVLVLSASGRRRPRLGGQALEKALVVTARAREVRYVDTDADGRLHGLTAADLLVREPAGLTSSGALVGGLALVIVHPMPGQKERSADHLLKAGAAIRCNTRR